MLASNGSLAGQGGGVQYNNISFPLSTTFNETTVNQYYQAGTRTVNVTAVSSTSLYYIYYSMSVCNVHFSSRNNTGPAVLSDIFHNGNILSINWNDIVILLNIAASWSVRMVASIIVKLSYKDKDNIDRTYDIINRNVVYSGTNNNQYLDLSTNGVRNYNLPFQIGSLTSINITSDSRIADGSTTIPTTHSVTRNFVLK